MPTTIEALKELLKPGTVEPKAANARLNSLQYALHLVLEHYTQNPRGDLALWNWFDSHYGSQLTMDDFEAIPREGLHKGQCAKEITTDLALKKMQFEPYKRMRLLKPSTHTYYMDTTRTFCIWFNKHPDIWTLPENKLRLIRHRLANPHMAITYIYRSSCLSEKAKASLQKFAKKLNLTLVDFDKDLPSLLLTSEDQKLYSIAKEEIDRTLNNTGGNFAAASDCVRVISGVLKQYGFYQDVNADYCFKNAPPILRINSPFAINVEIINRSDDQQYGIAQNNDTLILSYSSNKLESFNVEATESLLRVQRTIIENYQNPNKFIPEEMRMNTLSFENIYSLRKLISRLPEDLNVYRKSWGMDLVIKISGPTAFISLFRLKQNEFANFKAYCQYVGSHGLSSNDLRRFIKSKPDVVPGAAFVPGSLTWTDKGKNVQRKRDQAILRAVKTIERCRLRKGTKAITTQLDNLKLTALSSSTSTATATKKAPSANTGFAFKFPKGGLF